MKKTKGVIFVLFSRRVTGLVALSCTTQSQGLVWLVPHSVAPQHPTPGTPGSPAQNLYDFVWYCGLVWLVPQHSTTGTPGCPAQNQYTVKNAVELFFAFHPEVEKIQYH
jgi:hypothetical protein